VAEKVARPVSTTRNISTLKSENFFKQIRDESTTENSKLVSSLASSQFSQLRQHNDYKAKSSTRNRVGSNLTSP